MQYMVDTSVMVSAMERRDAGAISALKACGRSTIRSVIVVGELASGVESAVLGKLGPRAIRSRQATSSAYTLISTPPEEWAGGDVAAHFGHLTAVCSTKKIKLGQNGRWILAEALTHGDAAVLTIDLVMHELGKMVSTSMSLEFDLTALVTTES